MISLCFRLTFFWCLNLKCVIRLHNIDTKSGYSLFGTVRDETGVVGSVVRTSRRAEIPGKCRFSCYMYKQGKCNKVLISIMFQTHAYLVHIHVSKDYFLYMVV